MRMRVAICGLYILATFVFVSRWIYVAADILGYDSRLAELGIENHPPTVTIYGRALLVAIGAFVTLYFVMRASRPPAT